MLDVALSAVAARQVLRRPGLGKAFPEHWLVDDEGLPTTDTATIHESAPCFRWRDTRATAWASWSKCWPRC